MDDLTGNTPSVGQDVHIANGTTVPIEGWILVDGNPNSQFTAANPDGVEHIKDFNTPNGLTIDPTTGNFFRSATSNQIVFDPTTGTLLRSEDPSFTVATEAM